MKTRKLEKWLLLEQSGELSPRQFRLLNHELAVSDDARRLRLELNMLSSSINKPEVEPSPWAVTRIAARLHGERLPGFNFHKILKPVFALAAGLIIVAGISNFHGVQTSSTSAVAFTVAGVDVWDDPFEKDLCNLENLIASISGDPVDIMEM